MTPLDCCSLPRHEFQEDGDGFRYVCLNCGEWWPELEYDVLALAAATDEQREAEHFEHGREELGEVKP
jgi:hypothetical protein